MTTEVKPCPFCGSHEVSLTGTDWLPFVSCEKCGAEGPGRDKESDAIEAWNLRPTQPAEVTDAEIDALCLSLTGFMTRRERDRAVARAAIAHATQPAEVTDSMIREAFLANGFTIKEGHNDLKPYVYAAARAILALRPQAAEKQVPMTDEVFDLICNAIDKADTITMEGDYMLDSDDCIAVVRVMQALLSVRHGITAPSKKEQA